MHSPTLPNFLICGSGESGTSWLYAALAQHPQVFLPAEMRPEPHFFFKSWEYEKGFDYYLSRYFTQVPGAAVAVGERSSSYMFGKDCAERIAQRLPDVKLIFMLREPVDRAYSNWRFSVQSGVEIRSFEQAIRKESQRAAKENRPFWREIQPFAYVGRGMYAEQLERFFHYFPQRKMLILNSDRVKQNEREAFQRVCSFLGVDAGFNYEVPGTFPTSSVRSKLVQKSLRWAYGKDFDQAIERTRVRGGAGGCRGTLDRVLRLNCYSSAHETLKPETRMLLDERFRESNARLIPMVDWDPFAWKGTSARRASA